jgi:hypothetical protein
MNAEESDYMSNMAGVLLEAGTVYSSPVLSGIRDAHLFFIFLLCVVL